MHKLCPRSNSHRKRWLHDRDVPFHPSVNRLVRSILASKNKLDLVARGKLDKHAWRRILWCFAVRQHPDRMGMPSQLPQPGTAAPGLYYHNNFTVASERWSISQLNHHDRCEKRLHRNSVADRYAATGTDLYINFPEQHNDLRNCNCQLQLKCCWALRACNYWN